MENPQNGIQEQNGVPVQADGTAQPIQPAQPAQYDQNGQPIQNGQPVQYAQQPVQYDQNGQPIQNGQPVQYAQQPVQYDQNGQPVQYAQQPQYPAYTPKPPKQKGQGGPLAWFNKQTNKTKGIVLGSGIGVIVLIALVIVLCVVFGGKKFDMAKFYQIKVEGLNGNGVASVVSNEELMSDYTAMMGEVGLDPSNISEALQFSTFTSTIKFELSKTEKISNGEVVTATATFDKAAAEKLGFKVKNEVIKLNVAGLEPGTPKDVFADLEVKFSGVSPAGQAKANNNSSDDFIRKVRYEIDKSSGLKNGDVITITVTYNQEDANEQKVVVPVTEKKYTVSGLDEYLTDKTAFTDAIKTSLNTATQKAATDKVSGTFNSSNYGTPELVSNTLLTLKDMESYSYRYNMLVSIYKVSYKASSSWETSGDRYIAVTARNVSSNNSGNVTISCYASYPNSDLEDVKSDYIDGYKSDYIVTEIK